MGLFALNKAFRPNSASFWALSRFSGAGRLIKAKFLTGGI